VFACGIVFYLTATGHLGHRSGHSGVDLVDAMHMSIAIPIECVRAQAVALRDLLGGQLGRVQGPAAISAALALEVAYGGHAYMSVLVLLSIAIGFFNLLPIPGLDGGRIAFEIWALVTRRPLSAALEARLHGVFIVALLTFACCLSLAELKYEPLYWLATLTIVPIASGWVAGALIGKPNIGRRLLAAFLLGIVLVATLKAYLILASVIVIPLALWGYRIGTRLALTDTPEAA
jgi:Zn-dependent protease